MIYISNRDETITSNRSIVAQWSWRQNRWGTYQNIGICTLKYLYTEYHSNYSSLHRDNFHSEVVVQSLCRYGSSTNTSVFPTTGAHSQLELLMMWTIRMILFCLFIRVKCWQWQLTGQEFKKFENGPLEFYRQLQMKMKCEILTDY